MMEWLTRIFSGLLSMSAVALPVMAVVLAGRWLLRRAPRKYSYVLWFVVWFRLVCPWTAKSFLSIFNLRFLEPVGQIASDLSAGIPTGPIAALPETGPVLGVYPGSDGGSLAAQPGLSTEAALTVTPAEMALQIAAVVWLVGLTALLTYSLISWLRLRRSVATAVWQGSEVWECDGIPTPFILGLFRPRIYIPFHLDSRERTCILAHERFHLRRRDHWAKLLALMILTVYWWNPAVWLCWTLFCRDMEMRCDEAVLDELGDQAKVWYSQSLVSFALDRSVPTALAFGEHDAARRVKNVLRWKRETPRITFLAVSALFLVATLCLYNAEEPESWVQLVSRNDQAGAATFGIQYEIQEPIMSWAVYEDIYQEGTLVSSQPILMDSFEDAGGVSQRMGTVSFTVNPIPADGNWTGLAFNSRMGATTVDKVVSLPALPYTAERVETPLEQDRKTDADTEVPLFTVLFYTEEIPETASSTPEDAAAAVAYRLVLSRMAQDYFGASDEAQTLFDLRTDALDDDGAVKLLEALDTASLGRYTAKYLPEEQALLVAFSDQPANADELDRAMWERGTLLLALAEDLEEVRWVYPAEESTITVYQSRSQPDTWVQALGYRDLRDLGQSAAGIRALLEYLGWAPSMYDQNEELPAVLTVSAAAKRLYELAQDATADALAAELVSENLWGDSVTGGEIQLTMLTDGTAEITLPEGTWEQETLGWDTSTSALGPDVGNALLLMALRPEIQAVCWRGGKWMTTVTQAGANSWLEDISAPMTAIRAYGTSADRVQMLLNMLVSTQPRNIDAVRERAFEDILGYDGVCWTETISYNWAYRVYFAVGEDGSRTAIAESFGWGAAEDYTVDLDGDGVKELVCNLTYGGDGVRRARVYQRRSDGIYMGEVSLEDVPEFYDWGAGSSWSEYDPQEQVFRTYYAVEGQEEYSLLETRGLEGMTFSRFEL